MKFYSKITEKPETVSSQTKDAQGKVIESVVIAEFYDGVANVTDPEVIKKLKSHPEMYRTDKPWPTNYWQDTKQGMALIKKGEELNIDCRHIRKNYLISLIKQIEAENKLAVDNNVKRVIDYPELVARAEILGISTHKKKKEDLLAEIEEKEKGTSPSAVEIETKEVIIKSK